MTRTYTREEIEPILETAGRLRGFKRVLEEIMFDAYADRSNEDVLNEVRACVDATALFDAELARLRKREGYRVQGKTLKEWADLAEASGQTDVDEPVPRD